MHVQGDGARLLAAPGERRAVRGRRWHRDETHHQREITAWRWIEPEHLTRLIVPFKRPIYQAVIAEFGALL